MKNKLCTLWLNGLTALLCAVAANAQTNPPVTISVGGIVQPPARAVKRTPEEIRALLEQRRAAGINSRAAEVVSDNPPAETPGGSETPPVANNLAAAIAKMKFDRTPEALLQAVKSQSAGGKISDAEKFHIAVLLGDWEAVGKTLATLPEADAKRAYAKLLESVAGNSQSAAQFYQQTPQPQPQIFGGGDEEPTDGSGRQPKTTGKRSPLLPEDFYAIIAASPTDLDVSHLPQISSLVKIALGATGKKDFLAQLEKGLKGIGGTTAPGKKLAAQLLSSLDWIADAAPYLPVKRDDWDQADTFSLVLALEHFTQTGIQNRDERQFKKAAELCAFMMQTSRFGSNDRGLFRQATDRFVKLLPALGTSEAEQLIRENFLTQPAILNDLILALGESGQAAQRGSDLNLRGQSLATQSALVRVLAGRKGALPESLNVLVMNWLTEAETTYRSGMPKLAEDDPEMNQFIYRPPSYYNRRNQAKVVTADVILTNAPTSALIKRLNPGLAQRVNLTLLKVNLLDPTEEMTLTTLKGYLKDHPGQEKELCQDFLNAWVKKRSVPPEDPNITRMRNLGYSISRQQLQAGGGIPLTRLRQNKNVAEFRDLLAALRALSPEPISPNLVIQSFMTIHSGAEVYRAEDIAGIFGPPEKMNRAELMQLVTGMRSKLREQWQDPKTQQSAGTNRNEQDTKDEVSRGYRTALNLIKHGLTEEGADWKDFIVRGQLFFDASEFEFARQIKLSDYVNLRDEAFGSYKQAAKIYAAKVPELPRGQWTLDPYQMWFFVMLGASDLSQLTRAAARSDPGLSQIGDAMRALPGDAAEGHLQKFGEMLGSLLPQVPANMRQRFLSAGLQVIGEKHPSAAAAQVALKNYQELLDEAQLRVAVDGSSRVGHGQPFGMMVSLEHTRQIARESGGFGKYIQSPGGGRNQMMFGGGGSQVNYRENFAKNIHGALDETFEIQSITFHDASVRPIDLPREGWQETPLAYVLLRAKEAAVDRIPSIQLDMDFSDTSGQVVLPVRSQVEPIDSKETDAGARPCADLALTFTMDEREWAKDGKVVIEVTAKGRGVIAPHAQMFDFAQPGFDVEVSDNGLSITEFVSDGKMKQANADRNWQFTYKRKKDVRGDAVLKFPTLKSGITVASTEYQHYQDADLIKLDAKQAAAGVALKTGVNRALRTAMLAVLALVAIAAAFFVLRKKNQPPTATAAALALPAQLTPFSVVAFLRRIEREAAAKLDEPARQSLALQIQEIEGAFFRSATAPTNAPDLQAIAQKWWSAAK